ncbi:MAG: hypothetical protein BWY15_00186 [Firmicutes bacterium ADurb.Bin193]|nr:MAG: hypothetical protein BWY15_00186 [Firmicutes bacterium ADurb.Bin193]
MSSVFSDFTNQYQLTKTLRFELKPVGKTLEYIKENGLLSDDKLRAENYTKIKDIIDDFHKDFIDKSLKQADIRWDDLKNGIENYRKDNSKKNKDELEKLQKRYRNEIVECFKKDKEIFSYLFKKELITEILPEYIKNKETFEAERDILSSFSRFATYFTSFQETRKNIYSKNAISTAISYRLVHQNFPKFISNIEVFNKISEVCADIILDTERELAEILDGRRLRDVFSIEYYNNVLCQSGIDDFNRCIGGYSKDDGVKIRGLNEFVNLFNQKNNGLMLSKMTPLYKQILSDREKISFIPEKFDNDFQVKSAINEYCNGLLKEDIAALVDELVLNYAQGNSNNIYIVGKEFTNLSKMLTDSWSTINDSLYLFAVSLFGDNDKKSTKEKINRWIKSAEFSVKTMKDALLMNGIDVKIEKLFDTIKQKTDVIIKEYEAIKPYLCNDEKFLGNETGIERVKSLLDAIMELMHMLKVFNVSNELDRDMSFYSVYDTIYNNLTEVIQLYNKVRNYATQKPYSEDKYKLNFENKGNFLNGWVDSKTESNDNGTQYGGYLFRKRNLLNQYDYYLGVSSDVKLFRECKDSNVFCDYERLYYYQPKVSTIYGSAYKGEKTYAKDKSELITIIDDFVSCCDIDNDKLIAFKEKVELTPNGYINWLKKEYPSIFEKLICNQEFKNKNNEIIGNLKKALKDLIPKMPYVQQYIEKQYTIVNEIISDIEEISHNKILTYIKINRREMENALSRGTKRLYLFKITNKDLSFAESFEKGYRKEIKNKNLHTLYFEQLMSGGNSVFDLGTGSIFYRPASIESPFVHKKGEILIDRKDKNGNPIPMDIYDQLFNHFNYGSTLSEEAKKYKDIVVVKNAKHDIIKDKRFTQDKFLFHLSITINYKATGSGYINAKVLNAISNNPNVNIIGIDRGERNLLYVSLINQRGDIITQKSFNIAGGFDYAAKLTQYEKNRDIARKDWKQIGNIKELKEGYLSVVIHEIIQMMIKNNAIIVMEDLNFGFKRGRFKFERQVYQKFEKMLIDKLNYLADKKKNPADEGGILRGYQLTEAFTSFQKLGKQSGFIFYVPAGYTSKIDPTTGFVSLINLKWTSIENAQKIISAMDFIRYNSSEDYFEFGIDYDKLRTAQTDFRKKWTVCTFGDRYTHTQNKATSNHTTEKVNLTAKLKAVLDKYSIDYDKGEDIRDILCKSNSKELLETVLYVLKLAMQMRSTSPEDDVDMIISPVKNDDGKFFVSGNDEKLPIDADANGAFHIALKGLMYIKRIKNGKIECFDKGMATYEWLKFMQNREYKS